MKRFLWFWAVVPAVVFTACEKTGNRYDFAQILYPSSYGATLYADQTSDTLCFLTTYDWTLSTPDDWVHIAPDSVAGTVPSGYYTMNKVWLGFDANTTDTSRVAALYFNADGKSLVSFYGQVHYLNITRPQRRQYQFLQTDSATQTRDSLMFRTYADQWTLAFRDGQPSWMRLAEDAAATGRAGAYKVFYELDPNTTGAERTTCLQLTSRGVTTEIKIRQTAAKAP